MSLVTGTWAFSELATAVGLSKGATHKILANLVERLSDCVARISESLGYRPH